MRRLIFGAIALVTGVAATIGLVVRRRHRRQDDVLPIEPAPPLSAAWEVGSAEAGAATMVAPAAPAKPKRRRRRKPAGAATGEGSPTEEASSGATGPVVEGGPQVEALDSGSSEARVTTTAPKRRRPRREPAAAAADEVADSTGPSDIASGADADPPEPTHPAGAA